MEIFHFHLNITNLLFWMHHLDVAQWISQLAFDLDKQAFYTARITGHFPTIQWLVKEFNIAWEDHTIIPIYDLENALKNSHFPLIQWLVKEFNLTKDNLHLTTNFCNQHVKEEN